MDGLLGVAGMIFFLVMTGIIPENSLRLAPVSVQKDDMLMVNTAARKKKETVPAEKCDPS